jgi:murein DD-endopeptidase MepM/ murein hydrolase activator NlpD
MQMRRMRPAAVLTLAFVALPFVAATAVAAQSTAAASPAEVEKVVTISWLAVTKSSVQKALDAITLAASERIAPPIDHVPAPTLRATPPPPPPPPASDVGDPATWTWPGDGPITSYFGERWGRMHEGVDIDAAHGSPARAGQRGTVTQAGWGMSGYGLVVHIDHGNGIVSTFSHLSQVTVSVGQAVTQGQQVGNVGATGSVTAAHLHYEVHIGGVARNPAQWLPAGGASSRGNPG